MWFWPHIHIIDHTKHSGIGRSSFIWNRSIKVTIQYHIISFKVSFKYYDVCIEYLCTAYVLLLSVCLAHQYKEFKKCHEIKLGHNLFSFLNFHNVVQSLKNIRLNSARARDWLNLQI